VLFRSHREGPGEGEKGEVLGRALHRRRDRKGKSLKRAETMVESLIALGSNAGVREDNLRQGLELIGQKMTILEVSHVYETEPMYYLHQDWFLNCVAAVETALGPRALLDLLHAIERELGRRPGIRYGPRVIDLDILFYGDEVVSEPELEIPHPRIPERPFVLVPLNEIRPGLVHPVLKKRVSDLLDELKSDERILKRPELLADLCGRSPLRP
jgi:2-amino-4-hydroxy-6-hydroxymethyldihydropteridine diphosphokinase